MSARDANISSIERKFPGIMIINITWNNKTFTQKINFIKFIMTQTFQFDSISLVEQVSLLMMKYCIFFLIIGCLCNGLADTNDSDTELIKSYMYTLLMNFLKTCDLNLKKVVIFDDFATEYTFTAMANTQPQISVSLFSDQGAWQQMRRFQFDDLQFDAVIIFIEVTNAWDMMENFFLLWRYNRDCIIFIIPVPFQSCDSYRYILQLIMQYYFSTVYYICLNDLQYVEVYTHDPYGDTSPPHWGKISQELLWGKNWTFYSRMYPNDINELCPGFYFKRTDPSNQLFVTIGLRGEFFGQKLNEEEKLFSDEIEKNLIPPYQERIYMLKKLIKLQFQYFTIELASGQDICYSCSILNRAYGFLGIDSMILKYSMSVNSRWNYFYPVTYDSYGIISHDQGSMTPIEKIAAFYGKWTLLSLIIIMIITFIMIWLSTKNISLAGFDVLRLLINTEIAIPINTWPLKLFFSMIFLYFLVIHATFSGHLAEFLTKVTYRRNIETLADLKVPKIENIYCFGYRYDEAEEFDILRQKSEFIRHSRDCSKIMNNMNSACIAPLIVLEWLWMFQIKRNNILYISKNRHGLSMLSSMYRPGFPLSEKFDWAYIFLFETGIINRQLEQNRELTTKTTKTRISNAYITYRKVNMNDLHFALVLLIIGQCASFVCFLLEIGFKKTWNRLKTQQRQRNREIVSIVVQPCRAL